MICLMDTSKTAASEEKTDEHAVHASREVARDPHPRGRGGTRVRSPRPAHHRGDRRRRRLRGAPGRRERLPAGHRLRCPAGDDRVDPQDPRRAQGTAGDAGRFRRESANVTLRKLFETYGNIRPVRELPGVPTPYSGRGIDLVVVRGNVEDLYAGIEHMQTPGVAQCLKLISSKGCEKIVRLAFELALAEGRKRVHCATKSNIMKLTEGTLKRTFEKVSREYPGIEAQHLTSALVGGLGC